VIDRDCPSPLMSREAKTSGCPSIDALSELASGRVAKGREGPNTTELESTAKPINTLRGSGAESRAKKEVAW
jgi:hypothetical protein